MFGFSKKQQKYKTALDFDLLYAIYEYLAHQENTIVFPAQIPFFEIEAILYAFLDSFDECSDTQKTLANNRFAHLFDAMNKLFEAWHIDTVDVKEAIAHKHQYDFMAFTFYEPPQSDEEKAYFTRIPAAFYLIFTRHQDTLNDFEILYHRGFSDGLLDDMLLATYIDKNDAIAHQKDLEKFEHIVCSVADYLKLSIGKKLHEKYPKSLYMGEISALDFQKVITLVNYIPFHKSIEKTAQSALKKFYQDRGDLYFSQRLKLFNPDNLYESDWKFDAKDIEALIEEMLGEPFSWRYPENTYSHELFLYVQQALFAKNLVLMNVDTQSDAYMFFLVAKENVQEILDLSSKLQLGLERV